MSAFALSALGYGLMQSFLTPLLPTLGETFAVGASGAGWLISAFLLSAAVATPVAGRLGDLYGRAVTLRVVSVVFASGTIVIATTDNYAVFLGGRALQGVGGALFPLAFGVLREQSRRGSTAGGIGLISSMIAIGSGIGVSVAGPLAEWIGYRGVFLVAAVAALGSVAAIWWLIPAASPTRATAGGIGMASVGTFAAWVLLLLVGISQAPRWGLWTWATGLVTVAVVALLCLWLWVEARVSTPVVGFQHLRDPMILLANALAFAIGYLIFAAMVAVPTYVQAPGLAGLGYGATISETAYFMLPHTIAFILASLAARSMDAWPGSGPSAVLGAILSLFGCVVFVVGLAQPALFITATVTLGAGLGLLYSHLTSLLVSAVRAADTSAVSGLNANTRNVGGAVGAQATSVFFAHASGGFREAYAAMAVVALFAVIVACALARATRTKQKRTTGDSISV